MTKLQMYVNSPTLDILFGRVCGVFNDRHEGSDSVRLYGGAHSEETGFKERFHELYETRTLMPNVK